MFRNENEHVMGKAKSREASSAGPSLSKVSSSSVSPMPATLTSTICEQQLTEILSPSVTSLTEDGSKSTVRNMSEIYFVNEQLETIFSTFTISPTLEERAQAYFRAKSAVWLKDQDLANDFCSQTQGDEHLLVSMSAVGLASYANSLKAPELMAKARRDYVKAIRLTNEALRSPTEVKSDGSLFAVMILSVFEIVSGSNEDSLQAWTEHVKGAAAIVKLRGPKQFETLAGQRMFFYVTSNLMISCVQRSIPMPEHICELWNIASKSVDTSLPGWKYATVVLDFINCRASVQDRSFVGPKAIIEEMLKIEQKFIDVFNDRPKLWDFETRHTDKHPDLVWKGIYHVYHDNWIGQIWNGMRICRILLNYIIHEQLIVASIALMPMFTDEEIKSLNDQCEKAMLQMQADILASIPQTTRLERRFNPVSLIDSSKGYFILWPLYLAGSMHMSTPETKAWVINRIKIVADDVGIEQARVLADVMEHNKPIYAWATELPKMRIYKNAELRV
jgi:hypothetical protein